MRKAWVVKILPAAILVALGTTSLAATAASTGASKETVSTLPEATKPTVHSLAAQNMLDLLSADNTAQVRLQQKDISDPDGLCDYVECDKHNTSIAVKFSRLQLSEGAYLEVFSREDNEVLRYDAKEIATVTQRTGGVFTTPYVKGDNLTLRIVYPQGSVPGGRDGAVLESSLALANYYNPPYYPDDPRKSVACLKNGTAAEQQAYTRSQAIGYAPATGWLIGRGNYLLTNNHVLGAGTGEKNGDFIPYRSVRFNYESPDCNNNKAPQARDNLVNIKAGQFVATGGNNDSGNDWTLFTLDPLEHREAAIKTVFGGLALDNKDMQQAQMLSFIGHGREWIYGQDMKIADPLQGNAKHVATMGQDGNPCTIQSMSPLEFRSNCFITGGNSGSPALSKEGKVIGLLHSGSGDSAVGIPVQHLRNILSQWSGTGEFDKEVPGTGHARSAHIELPAFSKSSDFTFKESNLSFAPVVEGRQFTHKTGYSLLKSVARDNQGKEVDVLFRLAQDNACGVASLASTCGQPGATTLKVWLDREENAASIPEGNSVIGWLPVAVKSDGKLVANQILRYRYTHYIPQTSPFEESDYTLKKTITQAGDIYMASIFHRENYRTGMTAVRNGEGPLADSAEKSSSEGVPYSGMTPLFTEVIHQKTGQRYVMKLRGGLGNSCTKIVAPQGNWTPMNSSACDAPVQGTDNFSSGSVYVLKQDNAHLPAGQYIGMLPLMVRNWDTQEAQPVELSIDYLVK